MLLDNNEKLSFLGDKISIVMLLKSELQGASNLIPIRVGNGKILHCNYLLLAANELLQVGKHKNKL